MKLRIEDNSLRLRLSQAEVQHFAAAGRLESVVRLGPAAEDRLIYALERAESAEFRISYGAGAITVHVPTALAAPWVSSEQNGLHATLLVGTGQPLRILIEKDLDCRH